MLPTEVIVALIAAPGSLLALFFNWRNSRLQTDAGRIRDLYARQDVLNGRIDTLNEKLDQAREARLECESEKNEALADKASALAGKADAVTQAARCAQLHKDCEDERQRVTTLAMNLQRELDTVRKAKVVSPDYNDQTG